MLPNAFDPRTFHFVRHGVTEPNLHGLRCGGDLDVPMTGAGCDQAYGLGLKLKGMDLGIGLIVAGSLQRTRQTAMIIAGVMGGLPVEVNPLVDERRLGEWNNKPIAETETQLAAGATPPGGESEEAFSERIRLALADIEPRLHRGILVVSCKGVARVMHRLLGGLDRLQLGNGEVVQFSARRDAPARPRDAELLQA